MANNLYNTMYNPDVLSCIANLSSDEAESLEETIKSSLYTKSPVIITYLNNNKKIKEEKIVSKVDPINKNIFFTDRTKINFRQIYKAIQK